MTITPDWNSRRVFRRSGLWLCSSCCLSAAERERADEQEGGRRCAPRAAAATPAAPAAATMTAGLTQGAGRRGQRRNDGRGWRSGLLQQQADHRVGQQADDEDLAAEQGEAIRVLVLRLAAT